MAPAIRPTLSTIIGMNTVIVFSYTSIGTGSENQAEKMLVKYAECILYNCTHAIPHTTCAVLSNMFQINSVLDIKHAVHYVQ